MKLFGLEIKVFRTALYGFGVLVLIPFLFVPIFTLVFDRVAFDSATLLNGFTVGVCLAVFHQIAQLIHQIGHALVARAVGYPMKGIRYEYIFSMSEYPDNEPELPDRLHIQRSLGGVFAFGIVLAITLVIWMNISALDSELMTWLRNFTIFDAGLLFFLSAVVSDGVLFIRHQEWKNPSV